MKGLVGGKDVTVLVDSGLESNFINEKLLPELDVKKFTFLIHPITAADGHVIVPKNKSLLIELD